MRIFILSLLAMGLVACNNTEPATSVAPSGTPAAAATATATFAVSDDPALVAKGKELFNAKTCGACHQMSARVVGPPLAGITSRRSADWLAHMIMKPDQFVKTDPEAKQLYEEYKTPMPNLGITADEANAIIAYLGTQK